MLPRSPGTLLHIVAAPRAKTCAPDRVRLISCGVSPLYGTGASYTEIVAETDDDDENDKEEGEDEQGEGEGDGAIQGEVKKTKKQKKKKSGTDKQKVHTVYLPDGLILCLEFLPCERGWGLQMKRWLFARVAADCMGQR